MTDLKPKMTLFADGAAIEFADLFWVAADVLCCEEGADVIFTASGEQGGHEVSTTTRRCKGCRAELTVSRRVPLTTDGGA
jgi:hypothetical protein